MLFATFEVWVVRVVVAPDCARLMLVARAERKPSLGYKGQRDRPGDRVPDDGSGKRSKVVGLGVRSNGTNPAKWGERRIEGDVRPFDPHRFASGVLVATGLNAPVKRRHDFLGDGVRIGFARHHSVDERVESASGGDLPFDQRTRVLAQ